MRPSGLRTTRYARTLGCSARRRDLSHGGCRTELGGRDRTPTGLQRARAAVTPLPKRAQGRRPTILRMPRLIAVIMAAGQGTRMRPTTPKVLHDLCGWPLVRWPVEAARAAGADRVVVVGGPGPGARGPPARRRRARRPGGGARHGRRGALARASHIDADDTVVVLSRRRAAHHRRGDPRRSPTRTTRRGRAGDDGDDGPRRPGLATGASCATTSGHVVKVVETKAPGDATPRSSRSARSTPASSRSPAARSLEALEPGHAPTTPRASTTCPTCCRSCATRRPSPRTSSTTRR